VGYSRKNSFSSDSYSTKLLERLYSAVFFEDEEAFTKKLLKKTFESPCVGMNFFIKKYFLEKKIMNFPAKYIFQIILQDFPAQR